MAILLVGFDSAWTANNYGAIVGALYDKDDALRSLGQQQITNYTEAEHLILTWQTEHKPLQTIIMLDQPTIVTNDTGQRPVENIVGSIVGLRYGGMQPANRSKAQMFGSSAPIWQFLNALGGPANPFNPLGKTHVYETYPVLTIIAFAWMLDDTRLTGRLPKYNPARSRTFRIEDWKHVCNLVRAQMTRHNLGELAAWSEEMSKNNAPRKSDQDCLDACICLLVAVHFATNQSCLIVGNWESGYIVVPNSESLRDELDIRCRNTHKHRSEWVTARRRAR